MALWVKNRPVIQETKEAQFQFLSWEESLEEEMATHPVFLPGNSIDRGVWWATAQGSVKR